MPSWLLVFNWLTNSALPLPQFIRVHIISLESRGCELSLTRCGVELPDRVNCSFQALVTRQLISVDDGLMVRGEEENGLDVVSSEFLA